MGAKLYQEGPAEYGYAVIYDDPKKAEDYLFLHCPGRNPWQPWSPLNPRPSLKTCTWVLDGKPRRRWRTLTAAKRALKAREVRV